MQEGKSCNVASSLCLYVLTYSELQQVIMKKEKEYLKIKPLYRGSFLCLTRSVNTCTEVDPCVCKASSCLCDSDQGIIPLPLRSWQEVLAGWGLNVCFPPGGPFSGECGPFRSLPTSSGSTAVLSALCLQWSEQHSLLMLSPPYLDGQKPSPEPIKAVCPCFCQVFWS